MYLKTSQHFFKSFFSGRSTSCPKKKI